MSSYIVLARKYRPQTFEEVVGQNAVSQTLLNAIEAGRVAHAYVFSGPRGVGKTTTARILAKCLNCVKGPTKTPCNVCDACTAISLSTSTDDVLEIDGASNRGIEQIRELRESAKYVPSHSRYRIFIIDEAHQITKDAFGALLKTLEEPPPHVVFMLATTEVQKIPAPILSRCQRFSLRPISAEFVFNHLKNICQKEKIKVADEALADIVRFVEGSLRDALSLLDQAIVFAPNGITSNTIRDLLGLLPTDLIRTTAETIQKGEPAAVLQHIHRLVQDGVDLTQLCKDLQTYYHNLLLAKAGVEDAFKVNSATLNAAAGGYDFQTLERNIRLLARAADEMRYSDTPRAVFEICALRLAQKTLDPKTFIERLEKLEKNGGSPHPPQTPSFKSQFASPRPVVETAPVINKVVETSEPVAPSAPPAVGLPSWSEIVNDVAKTKASLATALDQSDAAVNGSNIALTFDKTFNHDMAQRALDFLKDLIQKKYGTAVTFDLKLVKAPAVKKDLVASAPLEKTAPAAMREEPLTLEDVNPQDLSADIQKALKHFPGAVKRERKS